MPLSALVRNLGEALIRAVAPAPPSNLSARHFDALRALIGGLPVGALLALIEGRASLDDDLELARQGAALVAAAFPPAAIVAGEVAFGLEALEFLLNAAGVGPKPFAIAPGENPLRGGFAGARGHI